MGLNGCVGAPPCNSWTNLGNFFCKVGLPRGWLPETQLHAKARVLERAGERNRKVPALPFSADATGKVIQAALIEQCTLASEKFDSRKAMTWSVTSLPAEVIRAKRRRKRCNDGVVLPVEGIMLSRSKHISRIQCHEEFSLHLSTFLNIYFTALCILSCWAASMLLFKPLLVIVSNTQCEKDRTKEGRMTTQRRTLNWILLENANVYTTLWRATWLHILASTVTTQVKSLTDCTCQLPHQCAPRPDRKTNSISANNTEGTMADLSQFLLIW